jgi:hypothetical protein
MYVSCQKYPTMPGEPHLGYVTECELIYDKEEAYELLADAIEDSGEVPMYVYGVDDYSEEDIELDVLEFMDKDSISELSDWLEELGEEKFPDRDEIYKKIKEIV